MVGKEVKMEGYLMSSLDHRFGDFTKEMETYIKQGKIISKHVIYNGIESFLESLGSMFSSSNIGKVLIQVNSLVLSTCYPSEFSLHLLQSVMFSNNVVGYGFHIHINNLYNKHCLNTIITTINIDILVYLWFWNSVLF